MQGKSASSFASRAVTNCLLRYGRLYSTKSYASRRINLSEMRWDALCLVPRGMRQAVLAPPLEECPALRVAVDMQGMPLRRETQGELQRFFRGTIPLRNWHHHAGRGHMCQLERRRAHRVFGDLAIMAPHRDHQHEQAWNDQHRQPGPFREFRNQHNAQRQAGADCPYPVDKLSEACVVPSRFPPVRHHAGLR